MNNKEREIIYNDDRYCVIFWNGGKIYTKWSLLELRYKKIEKLFKGIEYHIRPCTYNDYFMNAVAVLYNRLNAVREWRKKLGYIRIWKEHGGYIWQEKEDYNND